MILDTVREVINSARWSFGDRWRRIAYRHIYKKHRESTMISSEYYVNNLRVIHDLARDVPGCVVECGTWRGGMIAGIADLLGPERRYYLFDSFEGLPPAKEIDGASAIAWQSDTTGSYYHNNCTAPVEAAERSMARSRADDYRIIPGWFDQTLPSFSPEEPIAVLRLDGDWYESTLVCLEHLYHRLAPGGVVLIDDYYVWDGCARAVHHFLASRQCTGRISRIYKICALLPR
jgi:O-methyltransferase